MSGEYGERARTSKRSLSLCFVIFVTCYICKSRDLLANDVCFLYNCRCSSSISAQYVTVVVVSPGLMNLQYTTPSTALTTKHFVVSTTLGFGKCLRVLPLSTLLAIITPDLSRIIRHNMMEKGVGWLYWRINRLLQLSSWCCLLCGASAHAVPSCTLFFTLPIWCRWSEIVEQKTLI